MSTTDPQFLYMILVLPGMFGLTLIGDGLNKLVHQEGGAFVSIIFGVIFLFVVVFAYIFFSTFLRQQFG